MFQYLETNYKKIINTLVPKTNLLIVSKFRSIEEIVFLYELGHRHFAENKVQELEKKIQALVSFKDLKWHFIGHLQRNKVKNVISLPSLYAIHSVTSALLVSELLKVADQKKIQDRTQEKIKLFWEFNTSMESEKHGFKNVDEIFPLIEEVSHSDHFVNFGLMAMSPIRSENFEIGARDSFSNLNIYRRELYNAQKMCFFFQNKIQLSMGMSSDYLIAQEYDTDWVRVGSKIFEREEEL